MMYRNLFLASLAVMVSSACSIGGKSDDNPILSLQWEIVASPYPGTNETLSTLAITNNTSDTLDGGEPTAESPSYTEPMAATGTVAFRVFDGNGRGGRTVFWK